MRKRILDTVRAISWNELWHAYGPADEVDEQLVAAALGDDGTRKAARWELVGNIHHQDRSSPGSPAGPTTPTEITPSPS